MTRYTKCSRTWNDNVWNENYIICSRHEVLSMVERLQSAHKCALINSIRMHIHLSPTSSSWQSRVLCCYSVYCSLDIHLQKKSLCIQQRPPYKINNYRFDHWIEGKTNRLQDSHMIRMEATAPKISQIFLSNVIGVFWFFFLSYAVSSIVFFPSFVLCIVVLLLSFINFFLLVHVFASIVHDDM